MDLHYGQGEGHMDIQLFQHVLLKSLSFLHSLAFVLCPKTIVFSYCTLLLFFYVVQHCENKRRTDKDQTLWKINKTFNIIRPQFNSPCSSSATTSFFQSPPPRFTMWDCFQFPDCVIGFHASVLSHKFFPLPEIPFSQ